MAYDLSKETKGAWIIHHGRKIALDANGSAEFPVLDEAAKAANLLVRLSGSQTSNLSEPEVVAVARAARLNPRLELPPLLEILERRRLIERQGDNVQVLGITSRGVLGHAADIFEDSEPSEGESAAISLAEVTSEAPKPLGEVVEYIGDTFEMKKQDATDFLNRSEQIGFVDGEGEGEDRLIFNGNLFRRDVVSKTSRVLDSLSSAEQARVQEFDDLLKSRGCMHVQHAEKILGVSLFKKLTAAGFYDLNTVSNEQGEHVFVTAPGAFHKFVDPMIDDCFDMAKALVTALSYGMTSRKASQGRIFSIEALVAKLVSGRPVGPATAIGRDYRVLEQNRVLKLTHSRGGLYYMHLLKREVGELALQVLSTGSASTIVLNEIPDAPMSGYVGPERGRMRVRRKQRKESKRATQDILSALRGGRAI